MELRILLRHCPLIAILRGIRPQEAEPICAVLEEAGLSIVEIPLNSPEPLESIARLARRFGDHMMIGAGTVTDPAQVTEIASAGGKLILTPHSNMSIVRAAKAAGLLAIPGFFNPTEAFAAVHAGADAIKLFPAEVLGPAMLKALTAVLPPDTLVVPVGGIDATSLAPWIAAGARGFGVGSSIYKPGDTPAAVDAKARSLVAAVNAAR